MYECKICGFKHELYSEVWWHVHTDHKKEQPSQYIARSREVSHTRHRSKLLRLSAMV